MIKLIASDIDGTLVKEGSHEIDPAYYDVIRELKEAGIIFCACSGRQYHSMMELFKPVARPAQLEDRSGTVYPAHRAAALHRGRRDRRRGPGCQLDRGNRYTDSQNDEQ